MLTLTAIDKSFDQRKVLEKFQLKVAATEMVGIMGPSGCGKSTLLRLIAGLEKPDGGEIRWHGKIISNPQNIQPPHERQMGMIFQNLALWPHLTVEQHFAYGMAGVANNERQRRIVEVAEYLQITQLLKQFPSRLSGGEKQRVALGRALLANPQILLCDEPFSNLDQKLKIQIRELFIKTVQAEGITLIFVSHDAEDLQEMNRVIQMDKILPCTS